MVNKNFDNCVSFHIEDGAFMGRLVRLDEVVNTMLTFRPTVRFAPVQPSTKNAFKKRRNSAKPKAKSKLRRT